MCVAGARPNFVKIAPLMAAFGADRRFDAALVHTGQHYDDELSRVFFEELRIPRPDLELAVGSGSHAAQTAAIMGRFEEVLRARQAQLVIVVGDVNSTIACALAAAKFRLERPFRWRGAERDRPLVAHVEAGLRSFDDEMPEEINRRLTDAISDLLFVTERDAIANLAREGVPRERIHFVGNVMIDTLLLARERALRGRALAELGLAPGSYGLVTLHRPSNVDDPAKLREIVGALQQIAGDMPLVFPAHPRTRERLDRAGISLEPPLWRLVAPVGYLDFLQLTASARLVLTDSGGVQEETTVLGVPCLTLRDNTERPVTIAEGTNRLAGTGAQTIISAYRELEPERRLRRGTPELWDGGAAARIVAILGDQLAEERPLAAIGQQGADQAPCTDPDPEPGAGSGRLIGAPRAC